MRYLFSFIFLLFSPYLSADHSNQPPASIDRSVAPSQAAPFPCPKEPISDAQLEAILLEIYKPLVRSIERKVNFYHYGWRTIRYPDGAPPGEYDDSVAVPSKLNPNDFTGPMDPNPPVTIDGRSMGLAEYYFRVKSKAHFESPDPDEHGQGLYTATDPLGSMGFSGNSGKGLLLRIGVPPGVKYIDLRKTNNNLPATKAAFHAVYCALLANDKDNSLPTNMLEYLNARQKLASFTVHHKMLLDVDKTREILRGVYEKLGIQFIVVNYGSFHYVGAQLNKELDEMSEGIFVDPELAPKLDLVLLVPALEKNPSPAKRQVYMETIKYFDAFDFQNTEGTSFAGHSKPKTKFAEYYTPWATSLRDLDDGADIGAHQRKQFEQWNANPTRYHELVYSLFGCSKIYPKEYQPPNPGAKASSKPNSLAAPFR